MPSIKVPGAGRRPDASLRRPGSMRPCTIVAVEGPSGAGKSTATLGAAATGGIALPEAYVRLDRRRPLQYRASADLLRIERWLLREDGRRWQQARRAARRGRVVYLDTGVLGTLTYTWGLVRLGRASPPVLASVLRSVARATNSGGIGLPDRTVYIDTPPLLRRRRARRSPEGHPVGLDGLHARVGRLERTLWLDRWGPLLGERFDRIDGSMSELRVARSVARIGCLGSGRPNRGRTRSDRDLLLALLRSLAR